MLNLHFILFAPFLTVIISPVGLFQVTVGLKLKIYYLLASLNRNYLWPKINLLTLIAWGY